MGLGIFAGTRTFDDFTIKSEPLFAARDGVARFPFLRNSSASLHLWRRAKRGDLPVYVEKAILVSCLWFRYVLCSGLGNAVVVPCSFAPRAAVPDDG
jgi:hypothetical protein